jgi:LacI family transcriptional regulator
MGGRSGDSGNTMANIGIKDVAKHAGVSSATITRFVNNSGYVSTQTRKRVQKSIDILGYTPNRMAKALKNNRTGIIGNVVPLSAENPFYDSVSTALRDAALEYDYQILPLYHQPELEEKLINELTGNMAEGIIFTSVMYLKPRVVKKIIANNTPVIMIERPVSVAGADKIILDEIEGSSLAASHFIARGHHSLGAMVIRIGSRDRFAGFAETVKRNGLVLQEKNVVFVEESTVEQGYKAMKQIMEQRGKYPTGCFIPSDVLLLGALQYLYSVKLRVPEDISLIGYDNTLSAHCSPPITAIAIPFDILGRTAISLFRERREQKRTVDRSVRIKPFLLDRGSVSQLARPKTQTT